MSSNMMSIEDKRVRKNEMARIRRANGKNSVMDTGMSEPDSVPDPEPELPEPELPELDSPKTLLSEVEPESTDFAPDLPLAPEGERFLFDAVPFPTFLQQNNRPMAIINQ